MHLQPTDHVVVKACTVKAELMVEEELLRTPAETAGNKIEFTQMMPLVWIVPKRGIPPSPRGYQGRE